VFALRICLIKERQTESLLITKQSSVFPKAAVAFSELPFILSGSNEPKASGVRIGAGSNWF